MTKAQAPKPLEWSFVHGALPWLLAATALCGYLVTLNHGVRLASLPMVARTAGWEWVPAVGQPLHILLTMPFRLLPEGWIPFALNLFTGICAALVLGLLARSVALLPHDRLPIERRLERSQHGLLTIRAAWIPPFLAVCACGLQLSFWENATVASGAMLDLLLFAYVIRCLLEFRISRQDLWLSHAALAVGLGLANDWAVLAFLPLFVVALVWIMGWAFFAPKFLLRTLLLVLAGAATFLVLPVAAALAPDSPLTLWAALSQAVGGTAGVVWNLIVHFIHRNRAVAILLTVVSLLPILVMSIRWRRISADDNPISSFVSKTVFNFTHVVVLLAMLWVMFDPAFSPRQTSAKAGLWVPCLDLYYLSALSLGYFSGYFLLVLSDAEFWRERRRRNSLPLMQIAAYTLVGSVVLFFPTGLILKNLPYVRDANLPLLEDYAKLTLQSLPGTNSLILSDDPLRSLIVRVGMAKQAKSSGNVLLLTRLLPQAAYRADLHRKHPNLWQAKAPGAETNAPLGSTAMVMELEALSNSNRVYYLHPSFGYYFERFFPQPHGLIYELKPYPAAVLSVPALSAAEVEANEDFWQHSASGPMDQVKDLIAGKRDEKKDLRALLLKRLNCKSETPVDALVAGNYYSVALNWWGVQLQRQGQLAAAARCFEQAKELWIYNRAAEANLEANKNLVSGNPMAPDPSKSAEDQLGFYRDFAQFLLASGPVDDPNLCFGLGLIFTRGQLYRQSAQLFERVKSLAPGFLPARLALAQLLAYSDMPDAALEQVAQIRTAPQFQPLAPADRIELDFLEAAAHLAKTNDAAAGHLINTMLARKSDDPGLLFRSVNLFIGKQRYTNAQVLISQYLKTKPDDTNAIITDGYLWIQLGVYSNAIASFNRVLEVQTNQPAALLNRAVAYLRAGQWEASQRDYLELLKAYPHAVHVYIGLGEIAYQRKDTNAAVQYYRGVQSNSVPDTMESRFAQTRLQELVPPGRPGKHP